MADWVHRLSIAAAAKFPAQIFFLLHAYIFANDPEQQVTHYRLLFVINDNIGLKDLFSELDYHLHRKCQLLKF